MIDRAVSPAPVRFKIEFESCPVAASLGVLGRKWALLILRDIALYRAQRFNEMLRASPGLTKRTLSLRLNELERAGFIVRVERGPKYARWEATEKGRDVLPVLMTLVRFGSKWHAAEVFADQRPRTLTDIFDVGFVRRVLASPPPAARRRGSRLIPPGERLSSVPSGLRASA